MTQDAGALLKLAREWMEALTKGYTKEYGQAEYESALAKIDAGIARQAASQGNGRGEERSAVQSATAWRVWWVSLNTSRTELFEDRTKAAAKAKDVGGIVIPLFNMPGAAQAAGTISDADVMIVTARLRGLNVLKEDYGQLSEGRVRKALEASTLTSADREGK